MFTSSESFMKNYNGKFKNADNKHQIDWNQMRTLGIYGIGDTYWVASRTIDASSYGCYFGIIYASGSGSISNASDLCTVKAGGISSISATYGIRPIFILKTGIKVTGGSGTSDDPYTLGT